jgi:ATP-binding protein involved in chromosome partitioning
VNYFDEKKLATLFDNPIIRDYPKNLSLSLYSFIHNIICNKKHIIIVFRLPFPAKSLFSALKKSMIACLKQEWPAYSFTIQISSHLMAYQTASNIPALPNVKNIIAIASGKGGVGKSSTCVNLALALKDEGASVGILDADIYGPSIPIMLGIPNEKPISSENKILHPLIAHGIEAMSIGFLVDEKQAMVWRGPMASSALQQIVRDTAWGTHDKPLDYLLVDLPPGTGDIQLTLAQKIPVTAALIVTTPQDLALADAKKAITMFQKVKIPIVGIVENMSTHFCSHCGHQENIFGQDGGGILAKEYNVPLLGQLPLSKMIREGLDQGIPAIIAHASNEISMAYRQTAYHLIAELSHLNKDFSKTSNTIKTNIQ